MVDVWTKRARENNFNRNERLEGCMAFVGIERRYLRLCCG
jgi:hypothetical protein